MVVSVPSSCFSRLRCTRERALFSHADEPLKSPMRLSWASSRIVVSCSMHSPLRAEMQRVTSVRLTSGIAAICAALSRITSRDAVLRSWVRRCSKAGVVL